MKLSELFRGLLHVSCLTVRHVTSAQITRVYPKVSGQSR